MAELKTSRTGQSVPEFLNSIADERRRKESKILLSLLKRVTGKHPAMWGSSIVGFGSYHYVYESGREGDWFLTGFSPRKQSLVVYVMSGFERHASRMKRLGRYKTGKSCLYITRLEDIDLRALETLVRQSVRLLRSTRG